MVGYSAYCFVTVMLPDWVAHPTYVLGVCVGMALYFAATAALKKLATSLSPILQGLSDRMRSIRSAPRGEQEVEDPESVAANAERTPLV